MGRWIAATVLAALLVDGFLLGALVVVLLLLVAAPIVRVTIPPDVEDLRRRVAALERK